MTQSTAELSPSPAPGGSTHQTIFSTLKLRDLRLFLIGAFVSNLGTWLQSTALSWLILDITGKAKWLAMVALAQFGPMLLFGIPGGVSADRFPRRRILLLTQTILLGVSAALTIVAWSGNVSLWTILPLVTFGGCALAFNAPAFQAFISDLVPRAHVPTAVALNSSQFSISRVVGPAAAGWMLHLYGDTHAGVLQGVSLAFAVNTVTFLAVIAALFAIRPETHERASKISLESFTIAFKTAKEIPVIQSLVAVAVVISFLSAPVVGLLPVIAKKILNEGAAVYGQLFAAFGLGTAIGSIVSSRLIRRFGYRTVVVMGTLGHAVLLALFATSKSVGLSMLLTLGIGAVHGSVIASTNSGLQLATPARRRGRVMSLFLISFAGLYPLGALAGGTSADAIGAPATLYMASTLLAASSLFFYRFKRLPERRGHDTSTPAAA